VTIPNFEPLELAYFNRTTDPFQQEDAQFKREISANELTAKYWLNLKTEFARKFEMDGLGWYVNETYKKPFVDVPVSVNLRDIGKNVFLKIKGNEICNTSIKLGLDNLSKSKAMKVIENCQIVRIVDATRFGTAKVKSGCSPGANSGQRNTCYSRRNSGITMEFGSGWRTRVFNIDAGQNELRIKHSDYFPRWPIKLNDPWLVPRGKSQDSCNISPQYKVSRVRYCVVNSGFNYCSEGYVPDKSKRLLSLAEAKWQTNWPKPDRIEIEFQKIAGSGYRESIREQIKIGEIKTVSSLIPKPCLSA
jgi:hypothetical protein